MKNITYTGEDLTTSSTSVTIEKPPLGARPYWIAASERIGELATAILRNSEDASKNYQKISKWAEEIMQQCDMIGYLRDE